MYATGWWNTGHLVTTDPAKHFANFIQTLKPHPHERYASLYYHRILDERLDYVGRYENLQSCLDAICEGTGTEKRLLPHIEQRQRGHYSQYFDASTRELVGTLFSEDIAAFEYSFDKVLPYDVDAFSQLMAQSLQNAAAS